MHRLLTLTVIVTVIALAGSATAKAKTPEPSPARIQQIICHVFKYHCFEALKVAWCESRFNPWARNGQYDGLFQMGSSERATYGDGGHNAWRQAKFARVMFYATGHDWHRWQCQP